jgi:uncharacterized membrane protein HdeD (DUF308 family)
MSTVPHGAPASRSAAFNAQDASWKVMMTTGVIVALFGIAAIAVPSVASVSTTIFIGFILLFAGMAQGVSAFRAPTASRGILAGLLGLLMVIAGVDLLVQPESGTITLTFVLALWFFASGLVRLFWAIRERQVMEHAGMVTASGGLSIALGVLIANHLPSSAAWAIGLLVGIELLSAGALLMYFALALKRTQAV